jgi:hypothetical protein
MKRVERGIWLRAILPGVIAGLAAIGLVSTYAAEASPIIRSG